jgi:hypothetical protein
MRAEDFAIDLAERLQVGEIFFHVDHVPGETHEVLGPRAAFGEDDGNVAEGLTNLRDKILVQMALTVPADHTTRHHEAAVGAHAVGVSLWRRPAARLQNLRTRWRDLVLCLRPDSKIGTFRRVH